MVVQGKFCNRHFITDHKFSMGLGLRSDEFPEQSNTFDLFPENPVHFLDERHGK